MPLRQAVTVSTQVEYAGLLVMLHIFAKLDLQSY